MYGGEEKGWKDLFYTSRKNLERVEWGKEEMYVDVKDEDANKKREL